MQPDLNARWLSVRMPPFGWRNRRISSKPARAHSAATAPSYVFDALWGDAGASAVMAAAPKATIVYVGQAAGATAALASEAVRVKSLSTHGFSVYAVPGDVLAAQYRQLVSHAVGGDIQLDLEEIPLDSVADAWQRQAKGRAGAKLVVVP
jgi:hypothetical protein